MTDIAPAARGVIDFWFIEIGKERWFAKDDRLDAEIARRFSALHDEVVATGAAGWRERVETMLAAIILIDQFSRNIYRGSARAFAADGLALQLALEALEKGWTHAAPDERRQFLLMPLMHSEDLHVQHRSVEEFRLLGDAQVVDFAIRHRDQIARFGRFPGRNQALGRVSTEAEIEALASGAAF